MTEKSKLINLRESTSQRMDLSSEEQDKVFSQIAFSFLEWRDMDEVVETIDYMTTGGWQDCISKIVDELILKNEFGYAINTINLISSDAIKDNKYAHIIELKIKYNDKSRIEYLKSQISDNKLLRYLEEIIDDPKRIKWPEQLKTITSIESNEQKLKDIVREILKWYISQATDKLDVIFDKLTESELIYLSILIEEKIVESDNTKELQYLSNFLSWYIIIWFKNFRIKIEDKINKIHSDLEYKYAEDKLDKLINYIFNKQLKKIYKKNGDVIPELDNELLLFLKHEIEKSNIVKVSDKIPNMHTLFKLEDNKYVYLPEWLKVKDIKTTLKKLKRRLIYSYINCYHKDAR